MEIAIPVIGAVIQWILTTMLHIDKAFFIYGQEVRQYVVIVKVLYFLFSVNLALYSCINK